jgi:hypothetical protein
VKELKKRCLHIGTHWCSREAVVLQERARFQITRNKHREALKDGSKGTQTLSIENIVK